MWCYFYKRTRVILYLFSPFLTPYFFLILFTFYTGDGNNKFLRNVVIFLHSNTASEQTGLPTTYGCPWKHYIWYLDTYFHESLEDIMIFGVNCSYLGRNPKLHTGRPPPPPPPHSTVTGPLCCFSECFAFYRLCLMAIADVLTFNYIHTGLIFVHTYLFIFQCLSSR